ncbi:hypothetical protein [Tahibacter sp.]|uniref:hypothetical protein n=1 Tax=Tahibacter sp. TaxID=2056211 RepID=UPI0028C3C3A5|nr:hypothetical protein [Tahibacter sp.]
MLSHHFRVLVIAAALSAAYPVAAHVSPPVLVPSSPLEGQVLAIDVTSGSCDLFLGSDIPVPVTQNGTSVRVVLQSRHETSITFCNYGTGTGRYVTTSFLAGDYTLQIDRSYPTLFGTVVEPLATVPLVVRGVARPTEMPATGAYALVILGVGLASLVAAMKRFSGRQVRRSPNAAG